MRAHIPLLTGCVFAAISSVRTGEATGPAMIRHWFSQIECEEMSIPLSCLIMRIQVASELMLAGKGTRAVRAVLKNKRNRYVSNDTTDENNRGTDSPKRVRRGRRDQDLPRA